MLVPGTKLHFELCLDLSQTSEKSQHRDYVAVLLLSSVTVARRFLGPTKKAGSGDNMDVLKNDFPLESKACVGLG